MIKENGVWDVGTAIWGHSHSVAVAKAINDLLDHPSTVLDLGCGDGYYSAFLQNRGHQVYSYEGTKDIESISLIKNIIQVDLSTEVVFTVKGEVVCLEVGEHIPRAFEDVFINNITKPVNKKLILSWAVPGQGGDGHVNCRPNDFIIWKIESRGLKYNREESEYLRKHSSNCSWFNNTLMVFNK